MPKSADFWNNRFSGEEYFYGVRPNAFVESATAHWLPPAQEVLAMGAGEGRNAVFLAPHGQTVTAVDYATEGLRKTERLADEARVNVETIQADVRDWHPDRQWDAAIVTFLHLASSERPRLHRLLQHLLRPEGPPRGRMVPAGTDHRRLQQRRSALRRPDGDTRRALRALLGG